MKCAFERNEIWLCGSPGRSPHRFIASAWVNFVGQLERDFHRRRAVVGKETFASFDFEFWILSWRLSPIVRQK